MRSIFFVAALLALAACEAPPPNPAVVALQSDCNAGNMNSCAQLANIDAQNRLAYQQMLGNMQANNNATMQANNALWANTMQPRQPAAFQPIPTATVCRPIYGGGFQCM